MAVETQLDSEASATSEFNFMALAYTGMTTQKVMQDHVQPIRPVVMAHIFPGPEVLDEPSLNVLDLDSRKGCSSIIAIWQSWQVLGSTAENAASLVGINPPFLFNTL